MFRTLNPPDATEFAGKRAIVTGGSRGIGAAIVQRLLDGGAIDIVRAYVAALGGTLDVVATLGDRSWKVA